MQKSHLCRVNRRKEREREREREWAPFETRSSGRQATSRRDETHSLSVAAAAVARSKQWRAASRDAAEKDTRGHFYAVPSPFSSPLSGHSSWAAYTHSQTVSRETERDYSNATLVWPLTLVVVVVVVASVTATAMKLYQTGETNADAAGDDIRQIRQDGITQLRKRKDKMSKRW